MEKTREGSHTEDFEFAALSSARNYRAALVAEFRPFLKGNVAEIGAGIGQFSESIRALEPVRNLVSVEPEGRLCQKFRDLHPLFTLVEGVIDDLPAESDWDAILSVNVLEHIREDEVELAKYRERLSKTGGHLCLFVPARQELFAPIDRDFGHFRRYSKSNLDRALHQAGFEIERLSYFNFAGYFAWWLNFCVLKKRHFDPSSVRFFDRVIFPVTHGVEARVCRPPLGQSLIAVARACR
ncbi:MAG: methyltransferase domain-containing protein [Kiritimatiellia bacterium]